MQCHAIPVCGVHFSIALQVSSVPLSDTIMAGLPQKRHQPLEHTHNARIRQRRVNRKPKPAPRELIFDVEDAEPAARFQRIARLRPPRRRTFRPSSQYGR